MQNQTVEMLYKQKAQLILNYLLKLGCNREEAEDIVQDTFFKAIEHAVYLHEKNLSSWLFKVAINKHYDHCRKQKRHPVVQIDEKQFAQDFSKEGDGMTFLLKVEKTAEIKIILEKLSTTNKNLLILKYDVGLSYEKIANLLDMKQETVKTYLYRARKEFEKKWEEQHHE